MPSVDDQFLDDPDGQVRLAGSDLANDQQALVAPWIAFLREAGRNKVSFFQRGISAGEVSVVVGEFTVLVAARNAGCASAAILPAPAAGNRSA